LQTIHHKTIAKNTSLERVDGLVKNTIFPLWDFKKNLNYFLIFIGDVNSSLGSPPFKVGVEELKALQSLDPLAWDCPYQIDESKYHPVYHILEHYHYDDIVPQPVECIFHILPEDIEKIFDAPASVKVDVASPIF
jgi:hypothetical protein